MIKEITFFGIAICLLFALAGCGENEQKTDKEAFVDNQESRILIFSKTAGFRHESIDVAVPALTKYAEALGAEVHATDESSFFTDDSLARFDAVVFISTTGPLFNQDQQAAFERYIKDGGGFVGIHAASDTQAYPLPEDATGPSDEWAWYGRLVGAYFESHPDRQEARLITVDTDHPSTEMLGEEWNKFDEWYNFWELPDHVNVLLELDTDSYKGSNHAGHHPIAWYHEFDGGRSFYTGLGHTNESWINEELFLQHVWGGIQYAMRR